LHYHLSQQQLALAMTEVHQCFIPFKNEIEQSLIPFELNDPFGKVVPEICKIAALDLQEFLTQNQENWLHDFGHDVKSDSDKKGKMFGVLVVKTREDQLGYLATFSGKLADEAHHSRFVPSLFDIKTDDYYITKGMLELDAMSERVKASSNSSEIAQLKKERKNKSINLQQWLFNQYQFLNQEGETKSLISIFEDYIGKPPPSASGECAAPKLFQYAFEHQMKPLAIAEFWWGKSSKSQERIHLNHYPACQERCKPILSYMLGSK
jgi:tRNA pseudouridine32 synthase / 23S rRNA pseudouridine746 synthase